MLEKRVPSRDLQGFLYGLRRGTIRVLHGEFSKLGSLFIRVPYYIGDLEKDPYLEYYPHDQYRSLDTYR